MSDKRVYYLEARLCEVKAERDGLIQMLGNTHQALADTERRVSLYQEYWEASQAVNNGIIDFDLHNDQVTRLEKAAAAIREVLATDEEIS
jgi:hypothetical protein